MRDREIEFGRRVREAREALGYSSQPKFAEAAGIATRSVAGIERGEEGIGRKVRAAVARTIGWKPADVEDFVAGRADALPEPAARVSLREQEVDEAELRIINASHAELVALFRIVESAPGVTRSGADQWLVDALDLREHARQRREAAKRSVS